MHYIQYIIYTFIITYTYNNRHSVLLRTLCIVRLHYAPVIKQILQYSEIISTFIGIFFDVHDN